MSERSYIWIGLLQNNHKCHLIIRHLTRGKQLTVRNIDNDPMTIDNANTDMDNNSGDLNPSPDAGKHIIEDFISKNTNMQLE